MNIVNINLEILKEIEGALKQIDPAKAEELVDAILSANKVFVAGTGRSQLMIRGLAMRLMQLGFNAYVVGETVTPAIEPGDLFIIGSGSGETATMVVLAERAKTVGAKLALITTIPVSTIGKLADIVVTIVAVPIRTDPICDVRSIQPGASMFEQCLLIYCDAMVIRIIEKKNIEDSNAGLMKMHANLE